MAHYLFDSSSPRPGHEAQSVHKHPTNKVRECTFEVDRERRKTSARTECFGVRLRVSGQRRLEMSSSLDQRKMFGCKYQTFDFASVGVRTRNALWTHRCNAVMAVDWARILSLCRSSILTSPAGVSKNGQCMIVRACAADSLVESACYLPHWMHRFWQRARCLGCWSVRQGLRRAEEKARSNANARSTVKLENAVASSCSARIFSSLFCCTPRLSRWMVEHISLVSTRLLMTFNPARISLPKD